MKRIGNRKGCKVSKESREKMRKAHLGIPLSDSHKRSLSLALSGRISPMKGKRHSKETIERMSVGAKQKGFGKWMTGKHHSLETRIKISNIGKDRVLSGKHNNYMGGIERFNSAFKRSLEYKLWRAFVMKRDNYTCQMCGIRGGKLHVDHIKPFATFLELRTDPNNGRVLCIPCHRKTPTWGQKTKKIVIHS